MRLRPSSIVWLLGASQILGYGTLYYSFAILADDMARSLAVPVAWLYASFSLALLAGGFLAPLIGRRIDRHGAAAVMALGSTLSSVTLLAAAVAPNALAFTVALVAMQAASALVLYDAAFAALVQTTGDEARRRITHLTLIAGFASTIFWPLTSWLHGFLDWRAVLEIFAAANLLLCVPIHLLIARQPTRDLMTGRSHAAAAGALTKSRWRMLVLVTLAFALSSLALSAVLAQMIPTLALLGLGTSALAVSTLFGPAQVLVRFVNMLLGRQRHPMTAAIIGLAMTPLALLVLLATAPATIGAGIFAVLLGFGSGLKSIVQGTLPLALFGSTAYGARLGFMAAARQVFSAVAPFIFAALVGSVGPLYALAALAVAGVLGLGALLVAAGLERR